MATGWDFVPASQSEGCGREAVEHLIVLGDGGIDVSSQLHVQRQVLHVAVQSASLAGVVHATIVATQEQICCAGANSR